MYYLLRGVINLALARCLTEWYSGRMLKWQKSLAPLTQAELLIHQSASLADNLELEVPQIIQGR